MLFIATGLASSYWLNYIVRKLVAEQDNMLWRIPLIIQVVPSILLFIGMVFLFESPRWLCANSRPEEARTVLFKFRGTDNVDQELDQIQESISTEMKQVAGSNWKQVFSIENRKKLLLGCALQTLQQLTGTNTINYFGPIVFRSIGLSSSEAELFATGVYGVLKVFVVLFGFSSMIERFGRRPLLISGGCAMGICLYVVSICISTAPPASTPDIGGGLTVRSGFVSDDKRI
jgi:MFS family permease